MLRVKRRIGGAGTGKTSALMADMNRAREELGLSPEEIGATTFTRNGRAVLATRAADEWGCSAEALTKHGWFRTVHAIAMQQLGVSKEQLLTNNAASLTWISEAVGADLTCDVDESGEPEVKAATVESRDAALAITFWNFARSTCTRLADVIEKEAACGGRVLPYEAANAVITRYESKKRLDDRLDFHDLLLRFGGIWADVEGFSETAPQGDPPEAVRAWHIDEAQDASALVDRVCWRLVNAPQVERCLLSGDNFQAIFGFGGSDYRHFMSWKAVEEIMPRSYRCPAVVMQLGERCLSDMHEGYFDRQIAPADHAGALDATNARQDAIGTIDLGEQTLILARCDFSLRDYEKRLDAEDIPWRHLKKDNGSVLRGFRALWDLERCEIITHDEWLAAIQILPDKSPVAGQLFIQGTKELWADGSQQLRWDYLTQDFLEKVGCTTTLSEAIRAGGWSSLVMPRYEKLLSRWMASARRHGAELATNPTIALSTIHAAKGAEGDTVLLSTETSKRIEQSRRLSSERHDEECRVAYVGVTRARKRLIVVQDSARHKMNLPL